MVWPLKGGKVPQLCSKSKFSRKLFFMKNLAQVRNLVSDIMQIKHTFSFTDRSIEKRYFTPPSKGRNFSLAILLQYVNFFSIYHPEGPSYQVRSKMEFFFIKNV